MIRENFESAQSGTSAIKNIVLVHGAFTDGSCWAKIIPRSQEKGYNAVAVQNPMTSLAAEVSATKRMIALQDGPVLLVGHSWGGVVITEAGNDPISAVPTTWLLTCELALCRPFGTRLIT